MWHISPRITVRCYFHGRPVENKKIIFKDHERHIRCWLVHSCLVNARVGRTPPLRKIWTGYTRAPGEKLLKNADPFTNARVRYVSLWWGTTDSAADHRHLYRETPNSTRTVALYYYIGIDNLLRTRFHHTYAHQSNTAYIFNFISITV